MRHGYYGNNDSRIIKKPQFFVSRGKEGPIKSHETTLYHPASVLTTGSPKTDTYMLNCD